MFDFHITPEHVVASLIQKHIPKSAKSLLDPAVGSGALVRHLPNSLERVTCIDIDKELINRFHLALPSATLLTVHCEDFLAYEFGNEEFDCIICNPPFNSKKSYEIRGKKAPIEAAFLDKIIGLLSSRGRAILVLPNSVTKGTRLIWFRKVLLEKLYISGSYKLPKFTFTKIEGDFSIIIFDMVKRNNGTNFITSIGTKSQAKINNTMLSQTFDADELHSLIRKNKLYENVPFKSIKIGDLYSITRGSVTENFKDGSALHTTNYLTYEGIPNEVNINVALCSGDLTLKRVSRSPLDSLREFTGPSIRYTECIFRLRIRDGSFSKQALFSMQVCFNLSCSSDLLTKGSGAKYITKADLSDFFIFKDLHNYYFKEYNEFINGTDSVRKTLAKKVAFIIENTEWHKKISNNGSLKENQQDQVFTAAKGAKS